MSSGDSVQVDLRKVADKISEAVRRIENACEGGKDSCNEEQVRMEVEQILWGDVWGKLGVDKPTYEKKLGTGAYARGYGRADAFYGLVIFEYKTPKLNLKTARARTGERENPVDQVKDYIRLALKDSEVQGLLSATRSRGLKPLVSGVVTNGKDVIFVEYSVDDDRWEEYPPSGAYPLDERALRRLVSLVTASWRKRFTAENLAADFGYRSSLAKRAVGVLYAKLLSPKSPRTKALFDEWRKVASIVYPKFGEEVRHVARDYGIENEDKVEGEMLFFAIQTYYSIVLKLIAAEVASRFYDTSISAYLEYLKRVADPSQFKRSLELLEDGSKFVELGIKNFAERSFFSWYLDEWDQDIARVLEDVVRKLSEYDVSSVYLDVRSARDMLKVLYEELMPRKEVRQKLGIYSTPDWLAELLIRESGLADRLSDPCGVRVLDPACGTGTFLSLVIQEVGKRARPSEETLECVLRNVVGFDVEPLAVLTAKTNYLIALAAAGLLGLRRDPIELPIYMSNSLIPVEFSTIVVNNVEAYKIETYVGEFRVPVRLVREGRAGEFLEDLGKTAEMRSGVEDVARKYGLDAGERELAEELYEKLVELKGKGIDTVWVPIIKSYLTPLNFMWSFDYVVGNPPWLAYRYIADPSYQQIIKRMVKDTYGLVLDEHLMTHMELATLFMVRSADKYLKDGGVIAFVMPRSVFSADQHDRFRAGKFEGVKLAFKEIIDCEGVEPLFYVPTCAIVAEKGRETQYPVKGLVVKGDLRKHAHKVLPWDEARKWLTMQRVEFYYNSIGGRSYLGTASVANKAQSMSDYYRSFHQGATVVPQSAWLVDVDDASKPDRILVQSSSRVSVKGKVEDRIPPTLVEKEFVYGVLTSGEVVPFAHLPPNVAVLPIRPRDDRYEILTREQALRLGYEGLAAWLKEAERVWERSRGAKKEGTSLYDWLNYEGKLTAQRPKAKFRVVYTASATHLTAAVVRNESVVVETPRGKVALNDILIDDTLYWYDADDEDEAYYLAAVLNSTVLDKLVKPMQSQGAFGPRHLHKKPLEFPIPKYDRDNPLHRMLAELGRRASERAVAELPKKLRKLGLEGQLKNQGYLTPNQVGRLRREIRNAISDVLEEIDKLVDQLLRDASNRKVGLSKFMT